jgi:hypothetical protein
MKFAFIRAEKASFPIAPMCRLLGVTRQGDYAYAGRPPPELRAAEVALRVEVARIHEESRRTYGSPRVLAKLRADGVRVSKKRVERSMRAQGLQARPRGRFRTTTKANPKRPAAPNLLNRQFAASRRGQRWVTDITYVWTAEGWCYLAAILTYFARGCGLWRSMPRSRRPCRSERSTRQSSASSAAGPSPALRPWLPVHQRPLSKPRARPSTSEHGNICETVEAAGFRAFGQRALSGCAFCYHRSARSISLPMYPVCTVSALHDC